MGERERDAGARLVGRCEARRASRLGPWHTGCGALSPWPEQMESGNCPHPSRMLTLRPRNTKTHSSFSLHQRGRRGRDSLNEAWPLSSCGRIGLQILPPPPFAGPRASQTGSRPLKQSKLGLQYSLTAATWARNRNVYSLCFTEFQLSSRRREKLLPVGLQDYITHRNLPSSTSATWRAP